MKVREVIDKIISIIVNIVNSIIKQKPSGSKEFKFSILLPSLLPLASKFYTRIDRYRLPLTLFLLFLSIINPLVLIIITILYLDKIALKVKEVLEERAKIRLAIKEEEYEAITRFANKIRRIARRAIKEEQKAKKESVIATIIDRVLKHEYTKRAKLRLEEQIDREVRAKGLIFDSKVEAYRSIKNTVIIALIIIPLSIIASMIITPYMLSLLIIPAIAYYQPLLSFRLSMSNRSKNIDNEYPFFIALASMLASIGFNLYECFKVINKVKILFPSLSIDASKIVRDVEIFSMNIDQALSSLAKMHSNKRFASLLSGYTAIMVSGGNTSNYLEIKAIEGFEDLKFRMEQYKEQAGTYAEVLIIMLVIFPSISAISTFMNADNSMISIIALIMLPIMSIALTSVINASQPREHTRYEVSIIALIGAMISTITVLVLGTIDRSIIPYALPIGALVFAILNLSRTIRLKTNNEIENELPDFLREVTEQRKIGFEVESIVYDYKPKSRAFNELLNIIKSRIAIGYTLIESINDIVNDDKLSWLARYTIFMLGKIAESGSAKVSTLEQLTQFISNYVSIKKEVKSSVRMYEMLALFTPIMIAFMTLSVSSITDTISSSIDDIDIPSGYSFAEGLLKQKKQDPLISDMFIVLASLMNGIIMSKISRLTITDTRLLLIVAIITIIILITKGWVC